MKVLINIVSIILLTISIIVTIFTLTIFNNNFIYNSLNKEGIINNISNECNTKELKSNIKVLVKNKYKYINTDNECVNNYINIKENNINNYYIYIYIITFISIIITGLFFVKFKLKQDINKILLITSILLIIFYGIIKILVNFDNSLLNIIINKYNYYNLILAIIILEYEIFLKVKTRLKK